ncbi:MAG TPA: ABC transporter permease [Acidimicrobiales bacterium]|nr:ABC transporter permease [Acidimicrobiales bacterium]
MSDGAPGDQVPAAGGTDELTTLVASASTGPAFGDGARGRARWTLELVRVLAPRELRTRYRQSVLDVAWALISPIAVLIVYGIVLTQSFDVTGEGVPYLSLAWSGLVLWTFFAGSLGGAVASLISSRDLVTKVPFPREALPLSMAAASLVDLAIGLVTVVVLALVQGIRPGWTVVLAPIPLVLLVLWSAALGVFVAVFAAFVRDVPHVVQLVIRVGFFATPVMYAASILPPAFRWTAWVSPLAVAIEAFRDAVLRGEVPDLGLLAVHLAVAAALLVAAVRYTRSVEGRLTDFI